MRLIAVAVAVVGLIAALVFSLVKLKAARDELAVLRGETGEMSDEAVELAVYQAAAGQALKERDAALARVKPLEARAKSLTATLKDKRQFIDRANRIFRENDRLKREAQEREMYITRLESKLGR